MNRKRYGIDEVLGTPREHRKTHVRPEFSENQKERFTDILESGRACNIKTKGLEGRFMCSVCRSRKCL